MVGTDILIAVRLGRREWLGPSWRVCGELASGEVGEWASGRVGEWEGGTGEWLRREEERLSEASSFV